MNPGPALRSERAGALAGDDFGALASTRRQLRLICDLTGTDPELLSPLAGPAVAHFCGHRIAPAGATGRFLSEDEKAVPALVADAVEQWPTGIAYGSLASGGDILWVEALVASGCELHIVLPFSLEEFISTSVADAGALWIARFHRCLKGATSVTFATEDSSISTTTCSTPTTPSWPWAWRCCAPAISTPRSTSSRCGTATTTPATSARRPT
jgi:hypothetical protein